MICKPWCADHLWLHSDWLLFGPSTTWDKDHGVILDRTLTNCQLLACMVYVGNECSHLVIFSRQLDRTIWSCAKKFVRYVLRFLSWHDSRNLPPYEQRCRLWTSNHSILDAQLLKVHSLGKWFQEISTARTYWLGSPRPLSQRDFLLLKLRNRNHGLHEPVRRICQQFNVTYNFMILDVRRQQRRRHFLYIWPKSISLSF